MSKVLEKSKVSKVSKVLKVSNLLELLLSLTADRLVAAKDLQFCHKRSCQACWRSRLNVSSVSKFSTLVMAKMFAKGNA